MSATSLRHAAYHEAGHAVARIVLGGEPSDTWITVEGGGYSAGTGRAWTGRNPIDALPILTLAGPCAEARKRRIGIVVVLLTFGADDYQDARIMAASPVWRDCGFDAGRRIERWTWEARELLTAHWPAVERVAQALQQTMRVPALDLRRVVGPTNYPGRPIPPPRLRHAV
jgi:hypothetical protein